VFIWIFIAVYLTAIGYLSSDIVDGTCVPWSTYSSYAAISIILITYLLPLITMLFCYAKIVYILRRKVTHMFKILLSADT